MKGKTLNIILWVLSIFFLLSTFIMLSTTWASILFIIPAALLNPLVNKLLKDKLSFENKNWIKVCSAIIPLIIYSFAAPATSTTTNPIVVSSSPSSTILSSSSEYPTSSALSASLPTSSSQLAVSSNTTHTNSTTSVVSTVQSIHADSKLKVHYIDVGQGDSEFLELPNGQTMLIDAGNPENGSQIVNYIKSLSHTKIDYLIATHPHADHIGGMATVVNGLDIGKVYMPKVSSNTKTFEGLLTAIKNKGLQVNTAKVGLNLLKAGNLNVDMIAPVNITGDDLNQYSAVIKVTYGDNKFLFMGDAGNVSEAQITADVSADVLKVGHHGSNTATSQTFLSKVHPKYAIIEVGKGNTYGHPTATTLAKVQNIGATIYRTDNDGTIIFTSDSKTITISKKSSSVQQQAPPTSSKAAVVSQKSSTTTGNDNTLVYVTASGKKYHTADCSTIAKSTTKRAITLKEAKAKGYTACAVCNPPQ